MAHTMSTPSFFRQALFAVLLSGMTTIGLALPMANSAYAQQAAPAAASVTEAEIMASSPELFGFLKANFQPEFSGFILQIQTTVASGGNVDDLVLAHLVELRRKYAANLASASDGSLSALLQASIDLQRAVLQGEGPAACGAFAVNGPASIEGRQVAAKYADLIMAQTVYMLAAAKGGHDAPVVRAKAEDADWKVIADFMTAAGTTQAGFQSIATLDPANPELCPTLLTMLEAMNSDTSASVSRVRAEYMVELGAL